MSATKPADLHRAVERAFNAGDVDGLVELYEHEARMVRDDGSVAQGVDEIRDIWSGFVAFGGHIVMETRYAVEMGDTALLSNVWTFEGADLTFSSVSAEVAHRQQDGSWRYIIDNPFGADPATAELTEQ